MVHRTLVVLAAALSLCAASARAAGSDAAFVGSVSAVHAALSASFREASAARQKITSEEDDLLALLDSQDVNVRAAAARQLKQYADASGKTRARLLTLFQDRSENVFVRRDAARALSWGAADPDVRRALLDTAQRSSEPSSIREMSFKALYWQAFSYSDVRAAILEAAKRESDQTVRLAAIWALFNASGDPDVKDGLLSLAKNDSNVLVRVAALKSVWGEMSDPEVRNLARDYARETSTPALVRQAAILMLSRRFESEDTDLLQGIAQNDWDAEAKQAAILALGGPDSDQIVCYFHSFKYVWRDGIRYIVGDPIDQE